jgi:hypothetical protein
MVHPRVPGFTYLIEAVGTNRYKIGRTKNVEKRIQALQGQQCPFTLRLVGAYYSDDCIGQELRLHFVAQKYRTHGEWFEIPVVWLKYLDFWFYDKSKRSFDVIEVDFALRGNDFSVKTATLIRQLEDSLKNKVVHHTFKQENDSTLREGITDYSDDTIARLAIEDLERAIQLLAGFTRTSLTPKKAIELKKLMGFMPLTKEDAKEVKGKLKHLAKKLRTLTT